MKTRMPKRAGLITFRIVQRPATLIAPNSLILNPLEKCAELADISSHSSSHRLLPIDSELLSRAAHQSNIVAGGAS